MKSAGWLFAALVAAGWLACEWEIPHAPPPHATPVQWRRTADGWESPAWWNTENAEFSPTVHPTLLVAGQLAACLLALALEARRSAAESADRC